MVNIWLQLVFWEELQGGNVGILVVWRTEINPTYNKFLSKEL